MKTAEERVVAADLFLVDRYWCCKTPCSLDLLLALVVSLTNSASIHPVGAPEDDARTPGGQATYPCRPPGENASHAPSTSFAMRLKWIAPQPAPPPAPPPPSGNRCAPGKLCYMGLYDASPANLSGWGNLVFVEHEAEVEEARLLGMHSLVRIDKLLFNKTESGSFKGSLRRDKTGSSDMVLENEWVKTPNTVNVRRGGRWGPRGATPRVPPPGRTSVGRF